MSEIALTIIKVAFLALLWLFILSAVSVIRSDLFGKTVRASDSSRKSWRHRHHPREEPSGSAASRTYSRSPRATRLGSPQIWQVE